MDALGSPTNCQFGNTAAFIEVTAPVSDLPKWENLLRNGVRPRTGKQEMRKRIIIGLLAVVVIGVMAFFVSGPEDSEPKGGTVEWHRVRQMRPPTTEIYTH